MAGQAGRLAGVIASLICASLAWQIVTRTVAASLAGLDPRFSLLLSMDASEAAIRLADRALGQDPEHDKDDPERATSLNSPSLRARLAERVTKGLPFPLVAPDLAPEVLAAIRASIASVWLRSPLDARAPRLLGQISGDEAAAHAFMNAAYDLSKRETLAVYWLFQEGFLRGDTKTMFAHADILLRAHPDLAPTVVSPLLRAAAGPEGLRDLESALSGSPPWRYHFFRAICPWLSDLSLPRVVITDLRTQGSPATPDEVAPYIDCLVAHGAYAMARPIWLEASSAAEPAKLLSNGDFVTPPSVSIFDWAVLAEGGVRADFGDAPQVPGERALQLEFLNRSIINLEVKQTIVLPPGSYVFTGKYLGNFNARRGLRWRVGCVSRPSPAVAMSDRLRGTAGAWKTFSVFFRIPAENCPAQVVSLGVEALSDSDRIVTGSAWLTHLAINASD